MWPTKILYLVAFVSSFVGALGVALYFTWIDPRCPPVIQTLPPAAPHDWAKPSPRLLVIPGRPRE